MQPKISTTLFLCLIGTMLVSAAPSTSAERKCVDGKSYNDGCNSCVCDRGEAICTSKECVVYDGNLKEYVSIPKKDAPEDFWVPTHTVQSRLSADLYSERKCVDGKSYYDGCNSCVCDRGETICTLKECLVYDDNLKQNVSMPKKDAPEDFWVPKHTVQSPLSADLYSERKCVDGKSYNDGCNSCVCDRGEAICTLKECLVYDDNLKQYVSMPKKDAPKDFWAPNHTVHEA